MVQPFERADRRWMMMVALVLLLYTTKLYNIGKEETLTLVTMVGGERGGSINQSQLEYM